MLTDKVSDLLMTFSTGHRKTTNQEDSGSTFVPTMTPTYQLITRTCNNERYMLNTTPMTPQDNKRADGKTSGQATTQQITPKQLPTNEEVRCTMPKKMSL